MEIKGTRFVHFDHIGDGRWRLRMQLTGTDIAVEIAFDFTRDPHGAIWPGERLAVQQAHALLGEWLQSRQARDEPAAHPQ